MINQCCFFKANFFIRIKTENSHFLCIKLSFFKPTVSQVSIFANKRQMACILRDRPALPWPRPRFLKNRHHSQFHILIILKIKLEKRHSILYSMHSTRICTPCPNVWRTQKEFATMAASIALRFYIIK